MTIYSPREAPPSPKGPVPHDPSLSQCAYLHASGGQCDYWAYPGRAYCAPHCDAVKMEVRAAKARAYDKIVEHLNNEFGSWIDYIPKEFLRLELRNMEESL